MHILMTLVAGQEIEINLSPLSTGVESTCRLVLQYI